MNHLFAVLTGKWLEKVLALWGEKHAFRGTPSSYLGAYGSGLRKGWEWVFWVDLRMTSGRVNCTGPRDVMRFWGFVAALGQPVESNITHKKTGTGPVFFVWRTREDSNLRPLGS